MTGWISRLVRTGAVALLLVTIPWTTPMARAVSPPPVDDTLLPVAAPPAPPRPTEQQEQCASGAVDDDRGAADVPNQLKGLELEAVWRLSRGGGQTVAVIDTGVTRHQRLPRLVAGGDYVFTGDGTQDCDAHGTIVAGIVAATADPTGASAFSGVAPDATIMTIRQSSNKFGPADRQSGPGFGDVETLAMAVRTAADGGATVINVSSVACVAVGAELDDRALGAALAYAVDVKDVVVVAAAGNVGASGQCPAQNPPADHAQPGRPNWDTVAVTVSPGWYDDYVLTVGSVGVGGAPSSFSLAGPWVDVAAPGENVVSLNPDGQGLMSALPAVDGESMPISGTSYAAPIVSGVAALVRDRFPGLTARQVMQRIEDTAHRPSAGWDPFVGQGIVDALAAVSAVPAQSSARVDDAHAARRVTAPAAPTPPDPQPGLTASVGAALCMAALVATFGMTASAGRLRRRDTTGGGDAVTPD
ncbi:MAG: peptidase and in, kexin, sedolisin [Mycobacterium sp.]|nr:peptidase and in, kexin, sedolisin [Mycobacterium sp.]